MPNGVDNGHPEVYSNDSPGLSVGCLPTTPGPRTSSTRPASSVMIQWRVTSCTGSALSFEIRTVYRKNHSLFAGRDLSAAYSDCTETRTPRVIASDENMKRS